LVFEKNANFFAEKWQKSEIVVITTSTPGHTTLTGPYVELLLHLLDVTTHEPLLVLSLVRRRQLFAKLKGQENLRDQRRGRFLKTWFYGNSSNAHLSNAEISNEDISKTEKTLKSQTPQSQNFTISNARMPECGRMPNAKNCNFIVPTCPDLT
jgi:hypothetical protein